METTKMLSRVRAGERVSLTGNVAAEDAVVREDGKVSIRWAEGGGCLTRNQAVTILDDQLQALRSAPSLAATIGAEFPPEKYAHEVERYTELAAATAPALHTNFQTTKAAFIRAHEAAATQAQRLADFWARVYGDEFGGHRWSTKVEHHRSAIRDASFS